MLLAVALSIARGPSHAFWAFSFLAGFGALLNGRANLTRSRESASIFAATKVASLISFTVLFGLHDNCSNWPRLASKDFRFV